MFLFNAVHPPLYPTSKDTVQQALRILEKCVSRYVMASSWCDTLRAALETAQNSSSSLSSASAAREALEKDHYTVDPLQSLPPSAVTLPTIYQPANVIMDDSGLMGPPSALDDPFVSTDFYRNRSVFDMPLLDMQDLLEFTGDVSGLTKWSWQD